MTRPVTYASTPEEPRTPNLAPREPTWPPGSPSTRSALRRRAAPRVTARAPAAPARTPAPAEDGGRTDGHRGNKAWRRRARPTASDALEHVPPHHQHDTA